MTQQIRIGVFMANGQAARHRQRGMLQFAAQHPDLRLRFLLPHRPDIQCRLQSGRLADDLDVAIIPRDHFMALGLSHPDIPFVCLDALPDDDFEAEAFVNLNEQELGRAAAELLIRRGYCHFAYLGSATSSSAERSCLRGKAFSDTVLRRRFTCEQLPTANSHQTEIYDELPELAAALKDLPKPCAVFCFNDIRASLVCDACRFSGLSIPEQIAILGVDNDLNLCNSQSPTLSSILPDFEKSGVLVLEAARRLVSNKTAGRARRIYSGVKTIERMSTRDINASGKMVSCALTLIEKSFQNPEFSVSRLAVSLGVSRRLLDMRFSEVTGGTAHAALCARRLEEARHLLSTSRATVGEIAERSGFASESTFRAVFISREGKSPKSFRRILPAT